MTSLESKIGRMLAAGFDGLEAPDYLLEWVRTGRIGTVILFARNIESPEQVARLTRSLHEAALVSGDPLLICVDQEGGTVARMREAHGFTESPGAMALGTADDETLAENVSQVMARELRTVGVNWNLAPAIDVTHDIRNPTTGTRSLGTNPARVSALAAAQVRGFQRGGVLCSAKHFPGLGNTPTDTHYALAVIDGSVDYLWEHDLIPFRAVIDGGIESIMMTHVQFTALDAQYPSTLSPALIGGLLRDDLRFDGLVVTDCMEMKAVADLYDAGELAVLSALAGIDVVLFSHTRTLQEAAFDGMLKAAREGRLPLAHIDDANARVLALKTRYAIDPAALTLENVRNVIRHPDHLAVMAQAARAGCTLVRDDPALRPLPSGLRIGVVEFVPVYESAAQDGSGTAFGQFLAAQRPQTAFLPLVAQHTDDAKRAHARAFAHDHDLIVIVTRNAHLSPVQAEIALDLIGTASQSIAVCLRNPFDADVLTGADAILCTCGDSAPSLAAAVDALMGKFTPSGRLPVPLVTEFNL
ncbi:MAG: glycoside hydrolase family 3 protein [bacterium]|nr:glycoside hydrolase family 3 protein [bacterium]